MPRFLILALALLAPLSPARADEAITPETVEAVKKATVFIRVESDGLTSSGSGFVIAGDDKALLIATNDHVASAKLPTGKATTITVVFDSGTKTERSFAAQIAAADPERDLAVLRVAGVKDPPRPIAYADPPKLVETMPVYTFGFPFGKALSSGNTSPAITVGKASVSSLRNGADGELSVVQIDGSLNPGNSGGPVVDAKGRLAGVAVATIRDGQGIGFAIPAQELGRLMQGRVGRVRVTSRKGTDGAVTVRVEADLLDPTDRLRAAAAHYVLVAPKAKAPDATALDKQPGSKKFDLKVEKGVATGEFTVPAAEGSVVIQVGADAGGGKVATGRVRSFSLAPPPKPSDLLGTPLPGWKEYSPRDNAFVVWVPEKPDKQVEEDKPADGQRRQVSRVAGRTVDGLVYQAEAITLPATFAKLTRKEVYDLFRGILAKDISGKLTDAKDVTSGTLSGAEYVFDGGTIVTRARIYVTGPKVHIVRVTGASDQVASTEAEIMLASYRLPGAAAVAKGPNEAAPMPKGPNEAVPMPKGPTETVIAPKVPNAAVEPPGKAPTIIAGGGNPLFKDVAPKGGLLIGLELGLGKFGREDVIQAGRPIYRVDGKEQLGTQRGTNLSRVVTIKAKDGYAVGAMTCKSGLNFDGCSLTFMKVKADGTLDPKDSYESEWAGYVGIKRPVKLGGDGTPAVGLAGRATDKQLHGLGLLFKGQEGFDVNAGPGAAAAAGEPKVITGGKDPYILGSIEHDPKFKTIGPDGAILVGLEVRFGKFGATDIARAVRPIYRVNGKEEFGQQFGNNLTGSVTLKAKEGYAVGGITGKAGWWCNGFSLTFMKVKADGTLDPKDGYESEWVGFNGKSEVIKVVTGGAPVVGIVGKIVGTETTALGLLFKGQEDFDPDAKKK